MSFVYLLILIVLLFLAYVRLAPSDAARWHKPVTITEDKTFKGGAARVIVASEGTLAKLDAAAQALPRTTVLAGSVAEGRITYVTRSDYTTIEQDGDTIKLYARLRFGRSDLGVNGARLRKLLQAVEG